MARDRGIIYIYKDLPSRLRRDFSINRTTRLFTYVFAYVIRSSLSRLGFFVAARVLQPCGNSLEISRGESTTSRRGKTDDPFLEGRREREGYRFVEVCSREIAIEINIEKFSKLFELRFFFKREIILEKLIISYLEGFYCFEDGDYLSTSFCLSVEKAISGSYSIPQRRKQTLSC